MIIYREDRREGWENDILKIMFQEISSNSGTEADWSNFFFSERLWNTTVRANNFGQNVRISLHWQMLGLRSCALELMPRWDPSFRGVGILSRDPSIKYYKVHSKWPIIDCSGPSLLEIEKFMIRGGNPFSPQGRNVRELTSIATGFVKHQVLSVFWLHRQPSPLSQG